eukprot:UN21069
MNFKHTNTVKQKIETEKTAERIRLEKQHLRRLYENIRNCGKDTRSLERVLNQIKLF